MNSAQENQVLLDLRAQASTAAFLAVASSWLTLLDARPAREACVMTTGEAHRAVRHEFVKTDAYGLDAFVGKLYQPPVDQAVFAAARRWESLRITLDLATLVSGEAEDIVFVSTQLCRLTACVLAGVVREARNVLVVNTPKGCPLVLTPYLFEPLQFDVTYEPAERQFALFCWMELALVATTAQLNDKETA